MVVVGCLLMATSLAKCGSTSASGKAAKARGPSGIGSVHRSGTAPLEVVRERGATLAVAPVSLDGKGPSPFLADTGASVSVVDTPSPGRGPGDGRRQPRAVGRGLVGSDVLCHFEKVEIDYRTAKLELGRAAVAPPHAHRVHLKVVTRDGATSLSPPSSSR